VSCVWDFGQFAVTEQAGVRRLHCEEGYLGSRGAIHSFGPDSATKMSQWQLSTESRFDVVLIPKAGQPGNIAPWGSPP